MLDQDDHLKRRGSPNGHADDVLDAIREVQECVSSGLLSDSGRQVRPFQAAPGQKSSSNLKRASCQPRNDPFHNEEEPSDTETSSFLKAEQRPPRTPNTKLSFASHAVDFGDKGYLTSAERTMRSYDRDGSGKYSKEDVLRIVLDLDKERSRKKGYRRLLGFIGIGFLVLLVAVFGLMYSTITLTRQISVNSASELIDARTGQVLRTREEGPIVIPVTIDPSNVRTDNDGRRHLGRIYQGAIRESDFASRIVRNRRVIFTLTVLAGENDDQATGTEGSEVYTLSLDSMKRTNFERGAYRWTGTDATNYRDYAISCEPSAGSSDRWCYLSEKHHFPPVVTAVSQTEVTIWFRSPVESDYVFVMFVVDGVGDFFGSPVSSDTDYCGSVTITGLSPGQRYTYRMMTDGFVVDSGFRVNDADGATQTGLFAFRTLEPAGGGEDFSFLIFSDASKYFAEQKAQAYKTADEYEAIPDREHSFAFQIGDFDHSDPMTLRSMRDMNLQLRSPHRFHGRVLIRSIISKMPFLHIWDDHDYCSNDSDSTCPVKSQSFRAYNEYYPGFTRHPGGTEGNWYTFEAGHAAFFVLDTRSQRTPNIDPDPESNSPKTMLGSDQLAWLINGLQTTERKWKIIISTVTANIVARRTNLDHWTTGFKSEANIIKEAIASAGIRDNVLMISGDLHTGGGVDDGCNNGFNVAELSVPHTNLGRGNVDKLGDWTQGVSPGNVGGFGVVTVSENNLIVKSIPLNLDEQRIHSLEMPTPASTGCTQARPYDHNFIICSQNYHDYHSPNENPGEDKCLDIPKDEEIAYPFTDEDGNTLTSEVQFYKCETSQRRIIIANNVPHHTILRGNIHQMCERQWFASLPLNPDVIPKEKGKFEPGHHVGFAWDGVVTYGPLELSSQNALEVAPDASILDAQYWYGHTGQNGIWHYHNPNMGVERTLSRNDFLGYAMDGFPIYGPLNAPNAKLDECNFDETNKRYHIRTFDQVDESLPYCNPDDPEAVNWKYVIGCYRGNPRLSFIKNAKDPDVVIPDDCVLEDHSAEFADYYNRMRRLNEQNNKRNEKEKK